MTHHQWGRRTDAGRWIWALPTYTIGAVVIAGLTVYLAATYGYHRVWTEPQRAYLATYISSAAASAFALPPKRYELPAGGAVRLARGQHNFRRPPCSRIGREPPALEPLVRQR
jgi:hypothetical protein